MSAPRPCACACAERTSTTQSGPDTCAIVVAGGVGERFGDPRGKQYVELCGLPLACWSLLALDRCPSIGHIVVVCAKGREDLMRAEVLGRIRLRNEVTLALGGKTRQESVYSGLCSVPAGRGFEMVAIHDAARPLVSTAVVERCIARVRADEALAGAICAVRCTDTLKLVEGKNVVATPDRSFYWCAQTPQVFRTRAIVAAHRAAIWDEYVGTDDASLVERRGGHVVCVESTRDNIKVTLPEDLALAETFLQRRLIQEGCGLDPDDGPAADAPRGERS